MSGRTLMVMAGGTGGHVFPALAVADVLAARGWQVVWLGVRDSMEARLVPAQGHTMVWINMRGLRGKGLLRKLAMPFLLGRALLEAGAAIFRYRPDVVAGFGGYCAFPGGVMAWLLRRPLVIHEQNAVAGLTNRTLARLATRVLTGFPGVLREAGSEHTGNPVRAAIRALPAPAERFAGRAGALRVLVVGGSLGAQALNEVVPQALARLPEQLRPQVTHQAGEKHIEALRTNYAQAGVMDAMLVPFISDMAAAYAAADLVICRAGALTIAELAAAGVASVLVPFPHAVDDHQTVNAAYLAEAGAAVLKPQKELTADWLADFLATTDRTALCTMAGRARALATGDAALQVAGVCEALADGQERIAK